MTVPLAVVVLPYVTNILIKLSSLVLNRRLIARSLEDLAAIPAPARQKGNEFALDANRRAVIARNISHSTLIGTTILTLLSSFGAAGVLAFRLPSTTWVSWLFPLLFISTVPVVWWILPSKAYTFRRRRLGLNKATWLAIVFCGYDLVLATISVICVWTTSAQVR